MTITEIKENKKQYLSLLLLADEQEDMIDRYIEKGTMYVLEDNGIKCECIITVEGNGIIEIKNIATVPEHQGKGYGKTLIDFLVKEYTDKYSTLQVGTGDSHLTVPFYEKCGFVRSHSIPNFFTDNYDHPIYECGIQLVDMIYAKTFINQIPIYRAVENFVEMKRSPSVRLVEGGSLCSIPEQKAMEAARSYRLAATNQRPFSNHR